MSRVVVVTDASDGVGRAVARAFDAVAAAGVRVADELGPIASVCLAGRDR